MIKNIFTLLSLFIFSTSENIKLNHSHVNYSGIYKMNHKKSRLEKKPEGLTSSLFIIKQNGNNFTITRYHYYGKDNTKLSFNMTADGKTRRMKFIYHGKLKWKNDKLVVILWRKNVRHVNEYRFGSNKNEFIADEIFTGKDTRHHNLWVYDRINPQK